MCMCLRAWACVSAGVTVPRHTHLLIAELSTRWASKVNISAASIYLHISVCSWGTFIIYARKNRNILSIPFFQGVPEQKLRGHLGSFGITGNLALQPMYTLSGMSLSTFFMLWSLWMFNLLRWKRKAETYLFLIGPIC